MLAEKKGRPVMRYKCRCLRPADWLVAMAVAVCIAVVASTPSSAEIRPEARTSAVFVVEGDVTAVTARRAGHTEYYRTTIRVSKVVEIRVSKVVTVSALKVGDSLKVTSFKNEIPKGMSGASGHKAPPEKGSRIIAYVSDRKDRGGYEGIYRDWFDVLPR